MKLSNGVRLFISKAMLVGALTVADIVGKAMQLTESAAPNASPDAFSQGFRTTLDGTAHSWLALIYLVWNLALVELGSQIVERIVQKRAA